MLNKLFNSLMTKQYKNPNKRFIVFDMNKQIFQLFLLNFKTDNNYECLLEEYRKKYNPKNYLNQECFEKYENSSNIVFIANQKD